MPTGRPRRPGFIAALETDQVRRIATDTRVLFAVPDFLALLFDTDQPLEQWTKLLERDPGLASALQTAPFQTPAGDEELLPAAELSALLALAQQIPHPKAEQLNRWLAAVAAQQLEEARDPELAVVRVRRDYERQGYPRNWIDQRLRSISTRAEVVSEWHRRGAQTSEHYRTLTNDLMIEAFGMDVETYRQHKGLFGRENLRDHMSDLELALLSLAETIAANLHRSNGSQSLDELEKDMRTAGHIAANTRYQIETSTGQPVINGEHKSPRERRNPKDAAEPARTGVREVLFKREPRNM